jgi:hypothetical protein
MTSCPYRTTIEVVSRFLKLFAATALSGVFLHVFAQVPSAPISTIDLARQQAERIRSLVEAGAAPKARLQEAEQFLAEAQDEQILRQTLYGKLGVEDLTSDQTSQMVAAAQRELDREQAKLQRMQALVEQGVAARTDLTPILTEVDARHRTLDLAASRARFFDELAEMARAEAAQAQAEADQAPSGEYRVSERFDGKGIFTTSELKKVVLSYEKQFARPLPVSARGETALHRSLGFDHRGRVDVALNPDQPEGVWLRKYLERERIPFFAFRAAIPGQATAPHIHLGPPSLRLASAD